MENGDLSPTRNQLVKMSTKYRRPLVVFYLPNIPRPSDKGQDFRTLPRGQEGVGEKLLDALIRQMQTRQELVKSALQEADDAEELAFVGGSSVENGERRLSEVIGEVLCFIRDDFRAERNVDNAFKALRAATERIGIFVILAGNLGSHHSAIPVSTFRGFSLADKVAPFIVINENDSRSAWSFTLLHELTHILLGQTGISGYGSQQRIESFCDSVAAAFLIQEAEIRGLWNRISRDNIDSLEAITEFAEAYNVSRKMVAFNLLKLRLIDSGQYRDIERRLDLDREAAVAQPRRGTPDYYVVRQHRVGPGLVSAVTKLFTEGMLSSTKAGQVLGVKPTGVSRMLRSVA
jgi:Zn-dependent peptidase ImmA (M78 family)